MSISSASCGPCTPGAARRRTDRYLGSLEPDLLGETLVWSVLTDPEDRPQALLEQVFIGADQMALSNGFVVLGRISLQDPTVAAPWLAGVLEADIPGRARAAFLAALALGTHSAFSPLGLILAHALEREGTLDHAVEFDPLVPHQTVSLREVAVWTGRRILEFLSTQEDTQENLIERARLLNNLGNRLSDLGRREEALQAAQEALDIYRRLAKDRPDAFLPDLARSLGVLGTCLAADVHLRDAVAAFAEGVRVLAPAFSRLPQAFAPLMAALVSDYLTHVKELGESPDMELLAPILAKLEEIKGSG